MSLPEATQTCSDFPWRRNSLTGWLGPLTAAEWTELACSDEAIACHQTIKESGSWEGAAQCRGAAIFRANIFKSPRDPSVAVGPRDTARVFATPPEFTEHHKSPLADWLEEQRTG